MKRRGFLSLLAAVPLAPLIKLDESSRYRALARKMSRCWSYGKAEWRFSQSGMNEILKRDTRLLAHRGERVVVNVRLDGKVIGRKTIRPLRRRGEG